MKVIPTADEKEVMKKIHNLVLNILLKQTEASTNISGRHDEIAAEITNSIQLIVLEEVFDKKERVEKQLIERSMEKNMLEEKIEGMRLVLNGLKITVVTDGEGNSGNYRVRRK